MEVAGDIVQDMAFTQFGIKELESTGKYPEECAELRKMLGEVEEANNLRTHFNANISENMANVKAFVVRAEASLMIGDIDTMKHMYALV